MEELKSNDEIMAQFPDNDFGHEIIPANYRMEFAQAVAKNTIRDDEVTADDIIELLKVDAEYNRITTVALAMAYKILMSDAIKSDMYKRYNQYK